MHIFVTLMTRLLIILFYVENGPLKVSFTVLVFSTFKNVILISKASISSNLYQRVLLILKINIVNNNIM